jgi:large subunit ribosomal protein L32
VAVPKRKMSRSNTRHRRSQWKTTATTLTAAVEGSELVHSRPHHAKVVTDAAGTPLYLEYRVRGGWLIHRPVSSGCRTRPFSDASGS